LVAAGHKNTESTKVYTEIWKGELLNALFRQRPLQGNPSNLCVPDSVAAVDC
jgi:hypothetical protein